LTINERIQRKIQLQLKNNEGRKREDFTGWSNILEWVIIIINVKNLAVYNAR